MKRKTVAAGHICLDITPLFPEKKVGRPEELLIPGTLLHMDGADVHTGGSVANTGLAMKFFGADVRLMGKVGDDAFGKLILEILAQAGCDGARDMIVSPAAVTSYSVVLAIPGVDRIFLHAPGANDSYCVDDIDLDAVKDADLFHFGYPPLMKRMYENGGAELVRLFQAVKERGLSTSLDMAAIDPVSDAAAQDWPTILEKLMPYTDFFLPSAEELCFMLDRPLWQEWIRRSGGDVTEALDMERDIRPLAERLLAMGAACVVIKCGPRGLYYQTAAPARMAPLCERLGLNEKDWAALNGFQRGYEPKKLCSATGAGDVSIAAFLSAMLEGRGLRECMRLAAAAGAACVESYDALGGLKSFAELEKDYIQNEK